MVELTSILTSPLFETLGIGTNLLIVAVFWIVGIAIMIKLDGDWKDFTMYFLWNIAVIIGLLLLIVPGLIILAIFLWKHGLINIVALLLGPVGWAIGATQGWYD